MGHHRALIFVVVSPAWFFSTMAQSVAASIGFVIAFTASVYAVRRGRFQQRLHSFQQDVGQLQSNFGGLVSGMLDWLSNDWWPESPYEDDPPEAVQQFTRELKGIERALRQIPSSEDTDQMWLDFIAMEQAIDNARFAVDWEASDTFELRQALQPDGEDAQEGASTARMFDGFIDGHQRAIRDYLQQRHTGTLASSMFTQPRAWRTVLQELYSDHADLRRRHGLEWLDQDHEASKLVLRKSRDLFIIGVGLPMLYLLSLPPFLLDPIQAYAQALWTDAIPSFIAISQAVLLGLVLYKGIHLFNALRALIDDINLAAGT